MLAIGGLRLNIYTVDTVEHIKVIDIYRTRVGFHGGEYIRQRYAGKLHFVTVDIEVELGNVCLKSGRKSRQLFAFRGVVHQCIRGLHQVVESGFSACFELHLETARTTQTGNDGRCGEIDFALGIFVQVFLDLCHDFVDGLFSAFFPRLEDDGKLTACLAASHPGTAAGYALYILYCGLLHQIVHGTFRHDAGALQCCAFGQFQLNLEISLILDGEEAGGDKTVDEQDGNQYHTESAEHTAWMLHQTRNDFHIFPVAYT